MLSERHTFNLFILIYFKHSLIAGLFLNFHMANPSPSDNPELSIFTFCILPWLPCGHTHLTAIWWLCLPVLNILRHGISTYLCLLALWISFSSSFPVPSQRILQVSTLPAMLSHWLSVSLFANQKQMWAGSQKLRVCICSCASRFFWGGEGIISIHNTNSYKYFQGYSLHFSIRFSVSVLMLWLTIWVFYRALNMDLISFFYLKTSS